MVKWPAYAPTKMECSSFIGFWVFFSFFFLFLGFWIKEKNFLENKIGECPKARSEFSISIEKILIKTKKKRQTHNSCTLMNASISSQPCFSSRFWKQNNITRDHGSVVVIWLGHLERKMNLIKGKEKEEKRQPIMEYIKGSPIGWSLTQIGSQFKPKLLSICWCEMSSLWAQLIKIYILHILEKNSLHVK